jgi:hypothetical protein
MRNIIDENEVKRILTMHKSLKEQNTPPKPEMPTISEPQKVDHSMNMCTLEFLLWY